MSPRPSTLEDRLQISLRTQKGNDDSEQERYRLDLWRSNRKRCGGEDDEESSTCTSTGKSIVAEVTRTRTTDDEWLEYWDEEVEAAYYYNPNTGEATWINPAESGRHLCEDGI